MSKVKNTTIFFLMLLAFYSNAQQIPIDTSQVLNTVEVSTAFTRAADTGNKIQVLDSTLLNRYSGNNLGELLNTESEVYVKSYGLGTLATTSIRGGGSNHTAILWNGFNLQSPMYGPQDLSLIPISFLNEVVLQYGSSGATWGSGAVGGAIHLNNIASFNKGISTFAGASMGSFADKQQHATIEWSKKRFISSIKLSNHEAKNNFPFQNRSLQEQPMQRLTNAALKQVGFMNENYFQINEHQKINARFWYQLADRQIPPAMTEDTLTAAKQHDEAYRVTTEWQRTSEKLLLTVRAAYFYETLIYDNKSSQIHSNNSQVTILEMESKFKITKLDVITIALNNTYSKAISDGYENDPYQNRLAFIGSYKIHNKKNSLTGFFNFRQEFIHPDNKEMDTIVFTPFKSSPLVTKAARPLTFSIGGEGKFLKKLTLNFNVSQHYRIPSFNDLYWAVGGNINLKPESGWGEELGLTFKQQFHTASATASATLFNRTINNWILWSPTPEGPWSPDNIMQVWSRGLEYQLKFKWAIQKINVQLNAMWNYTVSTNERAKTVNDASVGKQLIYTPMYKGNGNVTVGYKNFSFTYNQKYVGYTYTMSDHTSYLKPYLTSNINLSQLLTISQFRLRVFAGVNNVFDRKYEVIQNRPMPGRNYQIGCSFYFNKSNKY